MSPDVKKPTAKPSDATDRSNQQGQSKESNTQASTTKTDSKGTTGFEAPPERAADQLGPDRPGYQEPTNEIHSTELSEGDSFREKELNHPHNNPNTPNTTMSGGPFNPDTLDRFNAERERMPLKTFVRNPLQASGNAAGVEPVALLEEPLNEQQVMERIAQVLKDGGMDSASQLRAFAQIKVILDAWEPMDSDRVYVKEIALKEQEEQKQEVEQMREETTEDNKANETPGQKEVRELREQRLARTKENLEKSKQSEQVVSA